MVSKILNFTDAMKLAQIVSKYFDTESLKDMKGEEFGYMIFDKVEEEEMLSLERLLLGEDMLKLEPREIIFFCVDGMIKNKITDLLGTYQTMGFDK